MPRSERGGQEVGSQEGVTKDGKEQTQDEGGKGESDQKESPEPKLSERYRDEDADVTIVSSDGVTFKVHSCFLKSSS